MRLLITAAVLWVEVSQLWSGGCLRASPSNHQQQSRARNFTMHLQILKQHCVFVAAGDLWCSALRHEEEGKKHREGKMCGCNEIRLECCARECMTENHRGKLCPASRPARTLKPRAEEPESQTEVGDTQRRPRLSTIRISGETLSDEKYLPKWNMSPWKIQYHKCAWGKTLCFGKSRVIYDKLNHKQAVCPLEEQIIVFWSEAWFNTMIDSTWCLHLTTQCLGLTVFKLKTILVKKNYIVN